ncbi:MAG: NAD(P)/FAD-dependent oxidoreductase [Methanomassiliicoccus sp.]|nr:NAD(P)/FAD-dependent oxidoreductase [Methanomassiliicoccus sp.]
MPVDAEVVIIGGGPVGSSFAAQTASYTTVVVEEHAEIGHPVQCTGLVHPRVVEMTQAQDTVLNEISGLRLTPPGGKSIEVRSNETKAMVIDRKRFDRQLSERAEAEGADILTGREFIGFKRDGKKVRIDLQGPKGHESILADLLVGADGYKSRVGRLAGLGPAKEFVRGIQADLAVRMEDQSMVEMLIGQKVAPGFFAWILPCGEFTRVGLGVSEGNGAPSSYLNALIKKRGLEGTERLRIMSGAIPVGPPKKTCTDNILIVGDAAAQTKPLSGGGLYTGLRSARWAAMTAVEALKEGDVSARRLSDYDVKWRADIGKEVDRGLLIRKVYVNLTDRKMDDVCRMLDRPDAKEVLSGGDIDYPSKIATPLLKTVPSLVKFSPQLIGSLIRREQR